MKTAVRAARIVLKIIQKQPDLDYGFYLRMTAKGRIITEFDSSMAVFHVVERQTPYQLYFMIGLPTDLLPSPR